MIRSEPWLLFLPPAVFLVATAACARPETEARPPTATARDSAGIEIVESHSPEWEIGNPWAVARTPEIVIGGSRDVTPADSSQLVWNVGDVVPLSDGRVALLSRGERRVLLFESSGAFSRSIGRVGRGPGEFGNPEHLQVLPGDTLVVWDFMYGPVAYFDPSGKLLRDWRIDVGQLFETTRRPNRMSPERVHQPLADGSFIVQVGLIPGDFLPPFGDPYRVPFEFFRVDSGYVFHSLGRWEDREHLYLQSPGPPTLPFPADEHLAGGGTPISVYIADSDRYEVHQYSGTGVLGRILRRIVDPVPISAAEVQEWKDGHSRPEDWRAWDRAMASLPPRFRPLIAGLVVDSQGYLWVMDSYSLDRTASEWSVFDPAGRWLGSLELPLGRVEWVGDDLILGISHDPDTGVQVVKGYRLNRGGGSDLLRVSSATGGRPCGSTTPAT